MQIGAMDEVVTLAVLVEQRLPAIHPRERAPVAPVTHALILGLVGLGFERAVQTEVVQRMCRRRAQRDSRTHFAELRRLFEYPYSHSGALQSERCREAAYTGADDADVMRVH